MAIKLTIEDTDAGTVEHLVVEPNDYQIITAGSCYLAHSQVFRNGTHVLTIKGREPNPDPNRPARWEGQHD